jgi:hypothetical protein
MSLKSLSFVAAAALALCAGAAQAAMGPVELTTNGNFETGTLAGWTTFAGGVQSAVSPGVAPPNSPNPTGVSNFAGYLSASGSAAATVIKQANLNLPAPNQVVPGETVRVEFDAKGSFADGSVFFAEFFSELGTGGTSKSVFLGGGPLFPRVWTHYSFDTILGPDVSGGVTLQLKIANGAFDNAFAELWVDNASVSVMRDMPPIPEPSTYALMLAGLAGVGLLAKRRRQA